MWILYNISVDINEEWGQSDNKRVLSDTVAASEPTIWVQCYISAFALRACILYYLTQDDDNAQMFNINLSSFISKNGILNYAEGSNYR